MARKGVAKALRCKGQFVRWADKGTGDPVHCQCSLNSLGAVDPQDGATHRRCLRIDGSPWRRLLLVFVDNTISCETSGNAAGVPSAVLSGDTIGVPATLLVLSSMAPEKLQRTPGRRNSCQLLYALGI